MCYYNWNTTIEVIELLNYHHNDYRFRLFSLISCEELKGCVQHLGILAKTVLIEVESLDVKSQFTTEYTEGCNLVGDKF